MYEAILRIASKGEGRTVIPITAPPPIDYRCYLMTMRTCGASFWVRYVFYCYTDYISRCLKHILHDYKCALFFHGWPMLMYIWLHEACT